MEIISRLIALIILFTLLPLILLIALLSLIFQGLPIIYKQKRIGYNYSEFNIYKFRTMMINDGGMVTEYNDARVTFFGLILRKTKMDEIPQLINIIKGDMRFIGPRPEVPEYFNKHSFWFLQNIKPGISDYASILLRDENKILKKIGGDHPYIDLLPIKLELAEYYSKNKSFLLDLKLVIITFIAIVLPKLSSKILINSILNKKLPKTNKLLSKLLLL